MIFNFMFILDSDFICSYFLEDQSTHAKANLIMSKIKAEDLYVLSTVLQELATMASRKMSHKIAIELYDKTIDLEPIIIRPTLEDEDQILQLFKSFDKKNISYIDCANLYFARKNNYKIATFDAFYPQDMIVEF
jgi:predicted nucleic acid-binding protein